MATKKTPKKKTVKNTRPVSGSKPVDPAQPVTPTDPTAPVVDPDPGVDPVDPDPTTDPDPADEATEPVVDVSADDFDASTIYPQLASPPEGFETAYPDLEQADYYGKIKELRDAADAAIAEAEAMEADYRVRFPAHRELKPQDQNVINQAHARLRRKEQRAKLADIIPDAKKAAKDLGRISDMVGGSRLDRVLKQRGKDPSFKRKFVPPAGGTSQE